MSFVVVHVLKCLFTFQIHPHFPNLHLWLCIQEESSHVTNTLTSHRNIADSTSLLRVMSSVFTSYDSLLSGYVNHQALPLDRVPRIENGKFFIKLPIRTILLHGNPAQVQGQHGRAIRINGKSQYLDFGEDLICKGNLANCESRGFTVQFAVRPERLIENMYLMDSFPLSVYYRDGKLWATARTPTMSWTTSTPDFIAGEWQLVEITWQPQRGAELYLYNVV